jgi:hypothetical protein
MSEKRSQLLLDNVAHGKRGGVFLLEEKREVSVQSNSQTRINISTSTALERAPSRVISIRCRIVWIRIFCQHCRNAD